MSPHPYGFIVIFCGVAIVFPLLPLALAWLWRKFFQPPKPGATKNEPMSAASSPSAMRKSNFDRSIIFMRSFF